MLHAPRTPGPRCAIAGLALACAGAARQPAAVASGAPTSVVDSISLAHFVDSLINAELQKQHIPGAAFVLVRNGKVIHARGYGLGRVQPAQPVDPARTIWRIGSISKTFTATAVAQLADRGLVHLSADANSYLSSVKVPSTYPTPVTVIDLLTHTAGFDEIRPGTQAATAEGVLPLAEFLRPRLKRIRPPGSTISYNTYGITLAGALVEDMSGVPFADFLRRNIWEPLGMTRTSIDVPADLEADVAVGYERVGDSLVAQAWEWYHTTPASSINSTARDMARYMIAHLEGGRLDGRVIWSGRIAETLLRQHVTMHPRLPGVTLGLFEDYVGKLRVVEHGGNMAGFSSQMTLIPSERTGFFIVHQFEDGRLRDIVREELLKWLYPAARVRHPVPAPPPNFRARANAFVGRYAPSTFCHTCSPRRFPYVLEVTERDNALVFTGRRWIEVDSLLFVREDGTGHIAFLPDSSGRVNAMSAGGFWGFEKLDVGGD